MKKDRNCAMNPYPVYPNYNGMPTPGMGPAMMPVNPNMIPMNQGMPNMGNQAPIIPANIDIINNQDNNDLANLKRQVNNLERRVNRLESAIDSSNSFGNKYTDSNYHVL